MRLDRTILSLAFVASAVAVPAFAQQPAASGSQPALSVYPECTAPPSKEDSDAAHNAYLFGKRKVDEGEYATAVNYFKDAYKTDCSMHVLLPMIARAYELAGNKAEAINALETYLKRVPKAEDAETQRKRIANLRAQLGTASTSTAPSATQTASAATTPTAPTATASATAPTATSTSTAAPTSEPPPADKGHSLAPWIVVGAGGVAVIAGVVVLIAGNSSVSAANNDFAAKGCSTSTHQCQIGQNGVDQKFIDTTNNKLQNGYTTEAVGGVIAGVGAAAVVGGLLWHFVWDKPAGKEQSAAGISVKPEVARGYAGVGVGGAF